MKTFSYLKQPDSMECGATCLRMITQFYGKEYSAETMQQLCLVTREGVSMLSISDAEEYLGLRTVCGRITLEKMVEQRPFPCILHWNQDRFVVLYDVKTKRNGKRINDHERVERFLTAQSLTVLFSAFSFVIFGGVLFYYNRLIFLIFLLGSILYAAWVFLFLKKRRLLDYTYFEQRARNQSKTMQLLSAEALL